MKWSWVWFPLHPTGPEPASDCPQARDPFWRQLGSPATSMHESVEDRVLPTQASQGSLAPEQGGGVDKEPAKCQVQPQSGDYGEIHQGNSRIFAHARGLSAWNLLIVEMAEPRPQYGGWYHGPRTPPPSCGGEPQTCGERGSLWDKVGDWGSI